MFKWLLIGYQIKEPGTKDTLCLILHQGEISTKDAKAALPVEEITRWEINTMDLDDNPDFKWVESTVKWKNKSFVL